MISSQEIILDTPLKHLDVSILIDINSCPKKKLVKYSVDFARLLITNYPNLFASSDKRALNKLIVNTSLLKQPASCSEFINALVYDLSIQYKFNKYDIDHENDINTTRTSMLIFLEKEFGIVSSCVAYLGNTSARRGHRCSRRLDEKSSYNLCAYHNHFHVKTQKQKALQALEKLE